MSYEDMKGALEALQLELASSENRHGLLVAAGERARNDFKANQYELGRLRRLQIVFEEITTAHFLYVECSRALDQILDDEDDEDYAKDDLVEQVRNRLNQIILCVMGLIPKEREIEYYRELMRNPVE